MIADNLLLLSGSVSGNTWTGQNVFASGASVLSTNTIDLGTARDLGEGKDLYGRFQITTAFAGGTTAEFQVIAADDSALSSNVTVIGSTGAIAIASLTVGKRLACEINPVLASKGQRYLGLRVVNVGANTAGAMVGDIGLEIQDGQKFYPAGFTVA